MKKSINFWDFLFLFGTGFFFFSCIATTMHVAKTLEPGQAEVSAGYLQARSIDDFSDTPIQLAGANGRIGIVNNFDAGVEYTHDISKENDGLYSTIWGDAKLQMTNKSNELRKVTLSSGLLKGYVYKTDAKIHNTSLPVYLSMPVSDRLTPSVMYRFELFGENFFPDSDSFDDPRHLFSLGLEYYLKEPDPSKWNTKFAISVGTIEDDAFFLNFGFKFLSPLSQQNR